MNQILENGTYDARTFEKLNIKTGYAIGMIKGTAHKVTAETMKDITDLMIQTVERYNPPYIGLWTDDDGITHIDPVLVIDNLEEAMKVGRENEQVCIWDFKNAVEIFL
jgi:hypothetical protein